ncbi:MAG: hypothetical protein JXA71_03905 [Chitinispirillaceae bacterium]|nr:hypothetical protein [Chitinispirillaceae bacterium]
MNSRQKYLMTLTICAAAGLLSAQQAQDSLKTTDYTQAVDRSETAPTFGDSSLTESKSAAAPASDTADNRLRPPDPVLLIKSKKDTVIVITDDHHIQKILQNMSNTVKKSRVQGYGGAGGFSNRLVAVTMDPVVDLVNTDGKLKGILFPTLEGRYKMLAMSGGLGYAGLGNGIRIGGGGYGGSCKYVSTAFAASDTTPDSLLNVTLKVSLGYGGLLIEKALVKENWNIYLGAFIGAGAVEVQKITSPIGKTSAFSDAWTDPKNGERATAAFMSTELHGGATYTLVPWMHIGGDFNALFYYSSSGFGQATSNSFFGITPGIGIRVIFGNIG